MASSNRIWLSYALPDEQGVEVKGKRTTVRELRAAAELQQRQALAQMQVCAGQESAKFAARRAEFLQKKKATLAAENQVARTARATWPRERHRAANAARDRRGGPRALRQV
ncbi:MAG: hypothetical protein H0T64_04880 [Pyrinomonadaceae bacterium]|nr:hypothetical protein [Pyrinomonadaceae bacterium]